METELVTIAMLRVGISVDRSAGQRAWRVGGEPEATTEQAYVDALDRIVAKIGRIDQSVSVYDFGHVKCPGISDIDLLCVVPEGIKAKSTQALNAVTAGEPLFLHGPLIATGSSARTLGWLLPGVETRHLAGERHAVDADGPDAASLSSIAVSDVFEGALARWFWLRKILAAEELDMRHLVVGLWALRRLVVFKQRANLPISDEEQSFATAISLVREQWRLHEQFDGLSVLAELERAPTIAKRIVDDCAAAIAERSSLAPTPTEMMSQGRISIWRNGAQLGLRKHVMTVPGRSRSYHAIDVPNAVFDALWYIRVGSFHGSSPFALAIARRQRLSSEYRQFLRKRHLRRFAGPPTIFDESYAGHLLSMADRMIARRLAATDKGIGPGRQ